MEKRRRHLDPRPGNCAQHSVWLLGSVSRKVKLETGAGISS